MDVSFRVYGIVWELVSNFKCCDIFIIFENEIVWLIGSFEDNNFYKD